MPSDTAKQRLWRHEATSPSDATLRNQLPPLARMISMQYGRSWEVARRQPTHCSPPRRTYCCGLLSALSAKRHSMKSLLHTREVNFLRWLLFRYPHQTLVTAVACKRSWSFCQKCRWKVTAKQLNMLACISHMWLCAKWHDMVVSCTQNAPRRQQFHVAPAM